MTAEIVLLKRTQEALALCNLKLHKIASNRKEVTHAFPSEDLASDLRNVDLDKDSLLIQHTLGVSWNLNIDAFTFCLSHDIKPFTRLGVLSTVNGLYDPFGFAAPVVIKGKALIRELSSDSQGWDTLEKMEPWQQWRNSLHELQRLEMPRHYTKMSLSEASHTELCFRRCFGYAAVAYLRISDPG